MNEPDLFGIRCDAKDALDSVIANMQASDPTMTIDNCVDAIFAVGLIATATTFTLTKP